MGVFDYYDLTTNGDHPICIHCGQCASICPFDSINERSEIDEVKAAIADPNKIVVFQTAPAVRVGLGEEFGLEAGTDVYKRQWLTKAVVKDDMYHFPIIGKRLQARRDKEEAKLYEEQY